jgi:hypothetical protein
MDTRAVRARTCSNISEIVYYSSRNVRTRTSHVALEMRSLQKGDDAPKLNGERRLDDGYESQVILTTFGFSYF